MVAANVNDPIGRAAVLYFIDTQYSLYKETARPIQLEV